QKEYEKALEQLDAISGKLEDHDEMMSLHAHGLIYADMNQYDQAITYWQKLYEKYPDNAQFASDYAVALASVGRTQEAANVLSKMNTTDVKNDILTCYTQGAIYKTDKRYEDAIKCFELALAADDTDYMIKPRIVSAMANTYLDGSNEGSLENANQRGIDFIHVQMKQIDNTNNAELWQILGQLYYNKAFSETNSQEDFLMAAEAFNQVIACGLNTERMFNNLYICYNKAGDINGCYETLDEMEGVHPTAYEPNAYRGLLYIENESKKPEDQRNYWPAYEQFKLAEGKLQDVDNTSVYYQLESYINELKSKNWLD
ncbi:MAG: tetratricopeptide repeat protein, partial [Erysipelotrichaceae bacterium]|nr:tetratricopeptide repeat protein [Erysipelotrichaceae bacterium]